MSICRNFKISISLVSCFQCPKFTTMLLLPISFLSIKSAWYIYDRYLCKIYTLLDRDALDFIVVWHCVNFKGIITFQVKYPESFGTCHASLLIRLQSHISFVSSLFFRHRLVLVLIRKRCWCVFLAPRV